ncbi:MAG TPA: molybdate ABC transporter permease subunit [Sulfurospirillum arcachonense]|nr:molybdate ABC transporter permease subunit [Sulfurospirillum arcachonense]HIP45762.1 molybdate ABC transporter permease subunit [Sulfurospirillum arcachonense]
MFFETMLLTFKVALITTIILFLIGIPIALWISSTKSRLKPIIETIVSMPLVLPPSVIGFYLLIFLGPSSAVGGFVEEWFDMRLVLSFEGILIGSILFSFPFMVHPIQSGLQSLPKSLIEASYTLGKSKLQTLMHVQLPNIKNSLLTGIVLTFAHTVGEFGVVLMIGGNIPGETRLASIAIYDEVEALNYDLANQYALTLFVISFSILLLVYVINRKFSGVLR